MLNFTTPNPTNAMEKQEVIVRFCALTSKVRKVQPLMATDCFCGETPPDTFGGYQFSEPVLCFIEQAVQAALDAGKKPQFPPQ